MEFKDYQKYKWFFTSSAKLVVGGKSAKQNDELLKKIKSFDHEVIVMHTSAPGSPFTIILDKPENVSKKDLEEMAIFTGCFSREWKAGKKKAVVDIFRASQLYKNSSMKEGTWGLNGKIQKTTVELKLTLTKQKETLRAVPLITIKTKHFLIICPGKIDKVEMLAKLQLELNEDFSAEEVLAAIPAGGIQIVK